MKKLLKYFKGYEKESILAPLFKLFEASLELIVPLVMAAIINKGIGGGDKEYVLKMCGVLVLLAAAGLSASITAQYFAAKAAVGVGTKLRSSLFSHIQSLSFAEMDQLGTSTLITRMTSDINQVQSGVNMVLRLFLRSPFIVFGAMIMAFTVDINGAMVFVVTIPLLSLVVFGVMLFSIPQFKKVQKALDRILGRTRENLEGVRVVRAFNKEEDETKAFNDENQTLTNLSLMVGRISALMNPMTFIIINCATIAVIWVAGKEVYLGRLSQGQVVALVNYMSQILVELIKLANLIILFNKASACANRIWEIMDTKPSVEDRATAVPQPVEGAPKVAFSGVDMSYSKENSEEKNALSQIDFTAEKGQIIGIIGGTGSGKSSLVNLIPRFYDVSAGSLKIDGVDVRDYPLEYLRSKVGIVMQKAVLFSGSVADNLAWGNPKASEEDMWKALELAQASEIIKSKKGGLYYQIEQEGRNLSGGQKQRLTIARAIVRQPEILILDDSASALDFATDAKLRTALKNIKGSTTIFIVSQRTSSIQFADKIIVLEDGRIEGQGTHEQLLESSTTYREIYDSQF